MMATKTEEADDRSLAAATPTIELYGATGLKNLWTHGCIAM